VSSPGRSVIAADGESFGSLALALENPVDGGSGDLEQFGEFGDRVFTGGVKF
jgi:hypothetical protein